LKLLKWPERAGPIQRLEKVDEHFTGTNEDEKSEEEE